MADTKPNLPPSSPNPRDTLVRSIPLHIYQETTVTLWVGPPGLSEWQQYENLIRVSRIYLDQPDSITPVEVSPGSPPLHVLLLPLWFAKRLNIELQKEPTPCLPILPLSTNS